MSSGIYKLTINGSNYVGLTIHLERRFKEHIAMLLKNKHYNKYLQSSYNKYQCIDFYILEKTDEWIGEKEEMWIEKLDSFKNGFNLNEGGNHPRHTEESKKKLSIASAGKNNPMYGKDWRMGKTKEELAAHGAKLSARLRNRPIKKETIEKLKILNTAEKNPFWCGISTEDMIKKVLEYQSVIKAAEVFGINKYTIRNRLKKAGYDFIYDGHMFSSYSKVIDVVRVK
jgi:group I intron endonuclease